MTEITVQSIIVGSVALFSALISGIIPNLLARKNDTLSLKRIKLELIYVNIQKWYNSFFSMYFLQFKLVMNKHIDWNGYLERIIERKSEGDQIQSEIILYLYFSNLEEDFISLKNAVFDVVTFVDTEMKKAYLDGIDLNIYNDEYMKRINHANTSLKKLEKKMLVIAKKTK